MTGETTEPPEYKGIGGWLIPHAIGLILGPLLQAWYAVHLIFIFTGNTWIKLTDPDSPTYDYFWKPSLIFEFAGHMFFLCYLIALLVLFFARSRIFPKLIILFFAFHLVYTIVDQYLCQRIPFIAQHSQLIQKGDLAIFRAALICLIWIPYFCVSKRVKNTFVE